MYNLYIYTHTPWRDQSEPLCLEERTLAKMVRITIRQRANLAAPRTLFYIISSYCKQSLFASELLVFYDQKRNENIVKLRLGCTQTLIGSFEFRNTAPETAIRNNILGSYQVKVMASTTRWVNFDEQRAKTPVRRLRSAGAWSKFN